MQLKPTKINFDPEKIFVSSDLHLFQTCENWDNPLWKRRGFDSVEGHYEGIKKNWNSVVGEDSIVFLLGDTIFGKGGYEKWLRFLRGFNFKHLFLMPGNHFAGMQDLINNMGGPNFFLDGKRIEIIPNYYEAIINGESVVMSHYFIASWNGQNSSKGASFHLHGHSHQSLLKGELADYISRVRAMDVGIDYNLFPLSFKYIYDKLIKIKPYSPDHHSENAENPF